MKAASPSVCANGPLFDLTHLVQGIKNKSISHAEAQTISMNLCTSAKSILLLALDQSDSTSPCRICSQAELKEAFFASAALIELAEFAVAETETKYE